MPSLGLVCSEGVTSLSQNLCCDLYFVFQLICLFREKTARCSSLMHRCLLILSAHCIHVFHDAAYCSTWYKVKYHEEIELSDIALHVCLTGIPACYASHSTHRSVPQRAPQNLLLAQGTHESHT